MDEIRVSIVTHDNASTIVACLDSVLADREKLPLHVTVLDHASSDGTPDRVREAFPDVELIASKDNPGFAAGQNRILRQGGTPYALVLNPDARLRAGALARLLYSLKAAHRVALVAPRIDDARGRPQLSFGRFPGLLRDPFHRARALAVRRGRSRAVHRLLRTLARPFHPDWVSGACFLARTDALARVDYFDDRYFLYLEDVDLCRRLLDAGLRVMVDPRARCTHEGGGSQRDRTAMKRWFRESRLRYENKFGTRFGYGLYRALRVRGAAPAYDPALRRT